MDAISTIIRMARLEAAIDLRCLLAGSHVLDNPPCAHGRVPFHVLLEGRCVAEVGDRTVDLRAGDVLILPRAGRHRMRVVADGPPAPAEIYSADSMDIFRSVSTPVVDLFCGHYEFRPGAGELLFTGLPDIVHASFGLAAGSPLFLLGQLMRNEATIDGPGAGALLASLCDALLALVLRGDGNGSPASVKLVAPWTAVADAGLRAVVDAVVNEPDKQWTIAGLARVAGVSRATLTRHFSAATGMGVADFLTQTRMTIAADLLTTTGRTLDDIAASVGYRSPSAFGKAFRTVTGSTPSRLRKDAADQLSG
ncbi:AraC family transcriptional regulator [Actinoplanes sp. TBRC 11911]|uniref:AraC family transcriptional regulator n=1 Tax=Actinoplanes sp. TBRC 11911 TaxID=2729386 RepID=UPI00145D1475|nr:AraC family transcriptional regulator [Actinoplanes sp. TBRC 11911]NMO51094.1 AraC family transcriptional regulator [Actinoplanes sp. TBRC 11911]